MFIALLTYKTSIDQVDEYLEEHNRYLDKNYQLGNFIFSGRRNPRIGGLILINQSAKEQVMETIAEDPFYKHGIAEYELIEFTPTKYDKKFLAFLK